MNRRNRMLGALGLLAFTALAALAIIWPRAEMIPASSPAAYAATPENIARGAYLARAGNCMGCHTAPGGPAYAGGQALQSPFGRFHGPNLTPDPETGLGNWSADDFWNALHNGIGRDGRLLYPAFPFPNYTNMSRADSDALYAFFRSLAPVRQPNRPHELGFPLNQRVLLTGWRLLYFRPQTYQNDPARDARWNRGAYLVQGLGHCSACHSTRNRLGASRDDFAGSLMQPQGWYAPSLNNSTEAGLSSWEIDDIVALLGTGIAPRASASGPMAQVVANSLQHLKRDDLVAMAHYLKTLDADEVVKPVPIAAPDQQQLAEGKRLYERFCLQCHGLDGQGKAPAYPPLAGNRALTVTPAVNAIRMVLNGGFPPATHGNPRPYGMPPFGHELDDAEVAAVLSYTRSSWGNAAPAVKTTEVNRYRAVPLE